MVHCFRTTLRNEGGRAFFKGMLSPVLGCAPINATLFVTYGGMCRSFLDDDADRELSLGEVMAAGLVAGFACGFVTTPADLIKIQLQNQTAAKGTPGYMGNIGIVKEIVNTSGYRALLRGLAPTLLRETPSYALYFGTYEFVRRLILPPLAPIDDGLLQIDPDAVEVYSKLRVTLGTLLAGGLGGTVSWLSTYPIDIIKTKMQGQPLGRTLFYPSIAVTFSHIVRTEGYAGFTRGLSACVTRGFPVNATTFYVYEACLRICSRIDDLFDE